MARTTLITVRNGQQVERLSGLWEERRAYPQSLPSARSRVTLADRPVRLMMVVARRFRCGANLCDRRIFTERFDGGVLAPRARRTARLDPA
jgi:hypothetical protein